MNDEIADVAGDSKVPTVERTGASPEAIISHYDKGEDFFKLVLGPELIYSCALFERDDDLAEAQRRKLDYHIEAANATNAKRVLFPNRTTGIRSWKRRFLIAICH
jgi:cyclopropane-fatty-acyl-phospholipid synthase